MKNIIISDIELFNKKINSIKKDGLKNLHVVSDFDQTLTKAFYDGKKNHSSFAQIRNSYLDENYSKISNDLYKYYYPFEISSTISNEERNAKMHEWWLKHMELMVQFGMNKNILKEIALKGNLHPREKLFDFLDLLKQKEIPILIFSAGLGDVIYDFLNHNDKLFKNLHIISNFYKFDNEGKVIGYKSNIVHTFNKNEYVLQQTQYFEEVKHRRNVILLGDNLGDVGMADGLEHTTVLRIGFLNDDIDNLLEIYKKKFDIILLEDQSMDYIISIIKDLI